MFASFQLSSRGRQYTRTILIVFALAVILRVGLLAWSYGVEPASIYDDDSWGYIELATNMAEGNGFAEGAHPPYYPSSFRTPGYPTFLLLHHAIFGSYFSALVTQIFLALLIAYVMILIGDKYLTTRVGIIAATIFLFMPFPIMASIRYLTQTLFTVVVMFGVLYWLAYLERQKTRDFLFAAFALPFAALVRPIAMFFYLPFVASLFLAAWQKIVSWRTFFLKSVVLVVIFFAALTPWMARNYKVFDHFWLSSIVPVQLYLYDSPAIYAATHHVSYAEARAFIEQDIANYTNGKTYNEFPRLFSEYSEITPILLQRAKHYMFEKPLVFAKTRALQFVKFFVRDGVRYWFEDVGRGVSEPVRFVSSIIERSILTVITGGFIGTFLLALYRRNIPVLTLALVVLYFAALTGVMASAGLRYPADPLLTLLGVAGVASLMSWVRNISFFPK